VILLCDVLMECNFGRVDLAREIVVDLIIDLIGNKFVAVTRLMYDRSWVEVEDLSNLELEVVCERAVDFG